MATLSTEHVVDMNTRSRDTLAAHLIAEHDRVKRWLIERDREELAHIHVALHRLEP